MLDRGVLSVEAGLGIAQQQAYPHLVVLIHVVRVLHDLIQREDRHVSVHLPYREVRVPAHTGVHRGLRQTSTVHDVRCVRWNTTDGVGGIDVLHLVSTGKGVMEVLRRVIGASQRHALRHHDQTVSTLFDRVMYVGDHFGIIDEVLWDQALSREKKTSSHLSEIREFAGR